MTCEHTDLFTAPELQKPCPECALYLERKQQGRRLVDLLDDKRNPVPEQVRREVIAGRWSEETRRWVRGL